MQRKKLPTSTVRGGCTECGLPANEGRPSCEEMRDQLLARDYEQPVLYWRFHRMAVDAYCLQHSDYVVSAKSLAAHLCGLCIAFERGNDRNEHRTLQRWLSTNPQMHKPQLPRFRGEVTIASVHGIEQPEEFGASVKAWAHSAWDAYHELHPLAREWLASALR